MPFFVEFPADPVVNVHWKKKPDDPDDPGDPTDFRQTCGAFQNGVIHGLPIGFSGIYVLGDYWLYMQLPDQSPGRLPTKPQTYFCKFVDYEGWITPSLPYIWAVPSSWTVTGRSVDSLTPYTIKEFRNINIQVFNGTNALPDQVAVETLEIENIRGDEIYPPVFICEIGATGLRSPEPHVLVQAHCCPKPGAAGCDKFETTGSWWPGTDNDPGTPDACRAMLPPQPSGWGTFFDPHTLIQYPAPGSSADPVRPPPGARRRVEPTRLAPMITPSRSEV